MDSDLEKAKNSIRKKHENGIYMASANIGEERFLFLKTNFIGMSHAIKRGLDMYIESYKNQDHFKKKGKDESN